MKGYGLCVGGKLNGRDLGERVQLAYPVTTVRVPIREPLDPSAIHGTPPTLKQRVTSETYHRRVDWLGQVFWIHESLL